MPPVHVRISSRARTGGRATLSRGGTFFQSKGRPTFQPTSVRLSPGKRGTSVRIRLVPSNYEWNAQFRERLAKQDPAAWKALEGLRRQYAQMLKEGKGVLSIPEHVPLTFGQSSWITIGGKYVLLALRSEHVRSHPGYYHMVGGIPFHPEPRRATNKLLRQNVLEELNEELGLPLKRVRFGRPLHVNVTLEPEGMGLSVIQPVAIQPKNVDAFIRKHFVPDGRGGHQYRLRNPPREGWEAKHFVLLPNTPQDLGQFFSENKQKMTPALQNAFEKILGGKG